MGDPLLDRGALAAALELASGEARRYLEAIDDEPVMPAGAAGALERWDDPMPERGDGALAALTELAARGRDSAVRSSGPRFFHFVMGGGTPAALGADWLASAYDQVAYAWASSPFAARLEQVAVDWLRQLFELPTEFGGVLTSGATMANFVALSAARNWWAERVGIDVEEQGLSGIAAPTILTSGYVHPSAVQAIGMLGLGRANVRRLTRDAVGRLDLDAMQRALGELDGPAIVIANAGEVNAGDFDPLADVADVARRHDTWLHVDAAFGLFARLTPETRGLTEGIDQADSVIADGHKWLNVPYDCGFAFVRRVDRVARALNVGAAYLPSGEDPNPNFGFLAPENSRRARALAVWATLRGYGRNGYRAMVERHVALARHLAGRVDAAPDLERLAEVPLNIVCFRAHPPGLDDEERLNDLNRRLGTALLADGRVFAGTTTYAGKVALRPAIVNWRTEQRDIDLLVDVVRELAAELSAGHQ
ncbi:MAG TPA: aminotransferase class V-fold PLP-dependent enzyme [Solirubrobacteraceae bacterium]